MQSQSEQRYRSFVRFDKIIAQGRVQKFLKERAGNRNFEKDGVGGGGYLFSKRHYFNTFLIKFYKIDDERGVGSLLNPCPCLRWSDSQGSGPRSTLNPFSRRLRPVNEDIIQTGILS